MKYTLQHWNQRCTIFIACQRGVMIIVIGSLDGVTVMRSKWSTCSFATNRNSCKRENFVPCQPKWYASLSDSFLLECGGVDANQMAVSLTSSLSTGSAGYLWLARTFLITLVWTCNNWRTNALTLHFVMAKITRYGQYNTCSDFSTLERNWHWQIVCKAITFCNSIYLYSSDNI